MDTKDIVNEIQRIKLRFDESHDTNPDYISPFIKELRQYVFQIHASYEQSMEIIIKGQFLRDNVTYDAARPLFDELSFYSKLKIVAPLKKDFPRKTADKLNRLRNDFAHKKGMALRDKYSNGQNPVTRLMEEYQFLEVANDELNYFCNGAKHGLR